MDMQASVAALTFRCYVNGFPVENYSLVFTAMHGMQTRSSDIILSVRLSVCLTVCLSNV